MNVTFVTAIVLPKEGPPHRPLEQYLHWGRFLVEAGIPLVVFVDDRLPLDILPGAHTVPTSMEGRWIETDALPEIRNVQKDTASYMSIQLQKLPWVVEASALVSTPLLAWIDFGVFHMIPDPVAFQERLRVVASSYTQPPSAKLLAPGCWAAAEYPIWSSISWRFCGSFILGPRDTFKRAAERQMELVRSHLPRLTWEINYWTLMEDDCIEWYVGSHNHLLLDLPSQPNDAPPGEAVPVLL